MMRVEEVGAGSKVEEEEEKSGAGGSIKREVKG